MRAQIPPFVTRLEPFNRLTHAEAERLALLAEELAEAIQVVGKILRHGYESYHPASPRTTNRQLLEDELGDVQHAVERMTAGGDLRAEAIREAAREKAERVSQYLHHQLSARPEETPNG